jgi:hypothetical protein
MRFNSFERGQALIMIALAAMVLFGFVALAIDGTAKFADRRHAQNAADTAAIAAALARARALQNGLSDDSPTTGAPSTCPPPSGVLPSPVCTLVLTTALDRAASNGYDNDLVTNEVYIHNPPSSGYYSDCTNLNFNCNSYIQVEILSHVDTYFARVIGFEQTHNLVEALAMGGQSNSSSLSYDPAQFRAAMAFGSSCSPDFYFSGNTYQIEGGIHTNGDLDVPGNTGTEGYIYGPSTYIAGQTGGGTTISAFDPPLASTTTPITDPFASEYTFSRFNVGGDIYNNAGNRIVVTNQNINIAWLRDYCYIAGVRCYQSGVLQYGIYVTTSNNALSINLNENNIVDDDPYDADNFINATFVSQQGGINISGNNNRFKPYIGNANVASSTPFLKGLHGILAATWWDRGGGTNQCSLSVISTSANSHQLQGHLYAPNGLVELNGNDESITGCILANSVRLNGIASDITCDATWFPTPTYSVGLID